MALYFECRINKKALPQTVFFFAILPTGVRYSTKQCCSMPMIDWNFFQIPAFFVVVFAFFCNDDPVIC